MARPTEEEERAALGSVLSPGNTRKARAFPMESR